MYPLKQSTAITFPFFAHDVNGDAVTGKVDGDWTKRISKGGGAFGAMTVTVTGMENGWYSITVSTSHSDTLGVLTMTFTATGVKQVNLQFRVSANLIDDTLTAALTTANQQAVADEILNRNIAGGGSGGARIVRDALRMLRNRKNIDGAGNLTVYQENDTTSAWTAVVTTAAGNPVREIDPA